MTPTWYPPSLGTGQFLTNPPFAMPAPPRRFVSLTRTLTPTNKYILDAIDEDGRAWWRIIGNREAPEHWTELRPLPSREDRP